MNGSISKALAGAALAIGLAAAQAQAGPTAAQKCEAGKNDAAGKYLGCLAKAESGFVASGDEAKYAGARASCVEKLGASWIKLEAGSACPSTGDLATTQSFLDSCFAGLAGGTSGEAPLPPSASSCADCDADLGTCLGQLASCDGVPIGDPVARTGDSLPLGAGSDGVLRKGSVRSFTDNGDGTITDNTTGLMWEKKDRSGGIHDMDNEYSWSVGTNNLDGTVATTFLATLNSESFAGHNDWRLPNYSELVTLHDTDAFSPPTFPEFNTECAPGCTVLTCSCTATSSFPFYTGEVYWTSSTTAVATERAWVFRFEGAGYTTLRRKSDSSETAHVRAVRSAS